MANSESSSTETPVPDNPPASDSAIAPLPDASSDATSGSEGSVLDPASNVPTPKKSWAALLKPVEGAPTREPPKTRGNVYAPPKITPYVETYEQRQEHRASEKQHYLGELLIGKNLTKNKLDHRTNYLTPRGMINRGNACYANAVLQALVFCPPFFHILESLDIDQDSPESTALLPPVTATFVRLIREFGRVPTGLARKSQLGREEAPLDPSDVYETLENHGTKSQQELLKRGNQEDAQEFLNNVLELIHDDMVKGLASAEENGELSGDGGESGGEWNSIGKKQKKSIVRDTNDVKDSPVSNVFCGKMRSVRKHHGQRSFGNVEPFFMLGLPIQERRVQKVFNALECFMQPESLHGFQSQGREVRAQRQYMFEQVPAVLILHLKYFEFSPTGGMAKLQKNVDFETTLRLPERWFAEGHYQSSKSLYKLFAVVFHYGEGTEGGHYTACLFHPAAQTGWIEANDSMISIVSFDYMRSPQLHRVPYLLFYRLQPEG